jgi:glycosidase
MRTAMIKAMKFWVLTTNIDGFRCDAADYVPFDFWQQAIDTLQNMKGRSFILLAEGSRTDHFTAGFQLNYAWDFLSTLKNVFISGNSASQLSTSNVAEYSAVPAGKLKLRFTTNHDESNIATPVTLFNGVNGALAASVIAICLQGTPLIYCGQEVGVSDKLMYSSNRPINWSMNPAMRNSYRQILNFYNISNALRTGTLQTFSDNDIITFTKTGLTDNVLVMVNCRNKVISYTLPVSLVNSTWTDIIRNSSLSLGNTLTLQPYQFYILKK